MTHCKSHRIIAASFRYIAGVVAAGFLLATLCALSAQAQSFTILHNFTGGADGTDPYAGLTIDSSGRLYGTTVGTDECYAGCGTVYTVSRRGSGWIFTSLYAFQGGDDGSAPVSTVTIAADGSLYGTTLRGGGTESCFGGRGCGTIYHLQPPAEFCASVSCPWHDTVLYSFQGFPDLMTPGSEVVFDQQGNIFGTADYGGPQEGSLGYGGIYELTPSQGQWIYHMVYELTYASGCNPLGAILRDQAGNIFGTAQQCGAHNNLGTAYELSPSGSGWTASVLYSFGQTQTDGEQPVIGLISDSAGNFYGTTPYGGPSGAGEVFELSPTAGGYSYSVLYGNFTGSYGPATKLVMDGAGNLYGAQYEGGAHNQGMIFKLTPGSGGWMLTDLHDFNGTDGTEPGVNMVLDRNGNLYGTARYGGSFGDGVVWELTP